MPDYHHIIGLTGYAGAGKTTVAGHLTAAHDFVEAAFADTLKDMLALMLGALDIDYAHLTEPHLKAKTIPQIGCSARHLMQTLGTEWGRRMIARDLWTRATAHRLGLHDLPRSAPVHDRIVITDVRFPDEADWLHRVGGILVRVHRPGLQHPMGHESEAHIAAMRPQHVILNDGSLASLRDQVDNLMHTLEAAA